MMLTSCLQSSGPHTAPVKYPSSDRRLRISSTETNLPLAANSNARSNVDGLIAVFRAGETPQE
jgi:hypothetical protein